MVRREIKAIIVGRSDDTVSLAGTHTVRSQKWLSQKALSRTRLRGELKEIKSLRIAAIPIVRASCSPNKNKINVRPEIGFTFGTLG